jgi:hypothetical protein
LGFNPQAASPVGAGLLAKGVNDDAYSLNKRGAATFFREQARSHSAAPSTSRCLAAAFVFSEITKWRAAWFP